ncbi:MAG TPA: GNAT family N-acetyltransferase [Thermoanaerobaculia bacterium]|nr:GNAT family N-acetyltransferase [Thermoanaerobaculia bacterium]
MKLEVVGTDRSAKWDRLVAGMRHDVYHLASYHRLAEDRGEGTARLIVLEDCDSRLLLPVLLRPVSLVPGLEGSALKDATSVYGYAGPLVQQGESWPESCLRFREELDACFEGERVCCAFSRLHPLLPQTSALEGLGEVREVGPTISIDLTLPEAEQWGAIRHGHRYDIRRLRREGAQVLHDGDLKYLDEFVSIYGETMRRVGADAYYRFDRSYFTRLFALKGAETHLFVCIREGEVLCGAVFTLAGGTLQYHLSGARGEASRGAPTKLLLDEVRRWAVRREATDFHLGGGLGSRTDSLMEFKSGFSRRRHSFSVWRWIRKEREYEGLVRQRESHLAGLGLALPRAGYFPAYRAPIEERTGREGAGGTVGTGDPDRSVPAPRRGDRAREEAAGATRESRVEDEGA